MTILCRLGRHRRTTEPPVWNEGYWFSHCVRCGCDMIRRGGGRWRVPRKGYKVVWRPRRCAEIDWMALIATRPGGLTVAHRIPRHAANDPRAQRDQLPT